MKSWKPHFPTVVTSIFASVLVVALLALAAGYFARERALNVCLSNTIDKRWSWTGHRDTKRSFFFWKKAKSDQEMSDSRRQAEAIARIGLKVATEEGGSLCPTHWARWITYAATRRFLGSPEDSLRWQVIYPIAKAARSGTYEFSWPAAFECAVDVKPTKLRISPRFKDTDLHPVGKIGKNMTIYCPRTKASRVILQRRAASARRFFCNCFINISMA